MITTTNRFGACSFRGKRFLLSLALAAALGATPEAWGAIAIWDGATSGYWSQDNWSGGGGAGGSPVSGTDSLRWTSTSAAFKVSTNDIVGLSVVGISFQSAPSGIVLNGNKVTTTGTIGGIGGSGPGTINLPLELNAATVVIGNGGDTITINGNITETGGSRAVAVRHGNITLNGANSFSGNVQLGYTTASGTVNINTLGNIGVNQSLGTGSLITFGFRGYSGTVIYTGGATSTDKGFAIGENSGTQAGDTVGFFINNGSGAVVWTGAQTKLSQLASVNRTLTLGGTNTDTNTWQSVIDNNNAGTIGLTKADSGKWILSGNNTYDGPTTVSAGILRINGNQSGATGAVSVASGASLGGSGTIGGAVSVAAGGILEPGSGGIGTLTVTGEVTLAEGAVYKWDCQNGAGDLVALTGSNGTLTLPSVATVQVSRIAGDLPSPATLFTATALAGATDLSGWTVNGPDAGRAMIEGTSVVLKMGSSGTLLSVR